MNTEELRSLVERARAEESSVTRPPADLLARAKRAARRRRLSMVGAFTAGTLSTILIIASAVLLVHRATGSTDPASRRHEPRGDAAYWSLQDPQDLSGSASTFTAVVQRAVGCDGGQTGTIYPPTISYQATQIVVTFSLAPLKPGVGYTCQGHDGEPYPVQLTEPINGRDLVDGACQSGQPAATQGECTLVDPVRWRPSSSHPDPCEGTRATLFQNGAEVTVFPTGSTYTFAPEDGNSIEWTTVGPCASQLTYTLDSGPGSSPIGRGGLTLTPGAHTLVVAIPTCAVPDPATMNTSCRGGLRTVISRLRVQ